MKRVLMATAVAVVADSAYSQTAKPVTIMPDKDFEKCLSPTPPQKIDYCLMWENKTGGDVELTYSAEIGT